MYAKNLFITFLGFLIALTAYFNSQSGIKEPFLGLNIMGKTIKQTVSSNGQGNFSAGTSGSSACGSQPNFAQTNASQGVRNDGHNISSTHRRRVRRENYNSRGGRVPTFTVPGTYQSNLSPRFQPQSYSANINYNAPSQQYLGVPRNALGYAADVQQPTIKENYKNDKLSASLRLDESAPSLPNVAMDQGSGQQANYTVDRFYTGLAKSPQLKGSDYIRGDLAILPAAPPCLTQAWGIPWQAYPGAVSTGVNLGAMSVLAGSNEADTSLSKLIQDISGGTSTIVGGVPYQVEQNTAVGRAMAAQKLMKAGRYAAQNTIGATA